MEELGNVTTGGTILWAREISFLTNIGTTFVHQWQLERVTVNCNANTQPKSVFCFALTVMGKVLAWDWDRKMDRIPICRMHVDLHESRAVRSTHAAKNGDRPGWKTKLEGDLEQRMQAIMESVNWVCEDLFKEEHEWVTQLTLSESEGLILVDLEYNLDVPCVMQWAHLWFTAPFRSNLYHEDNGTHEDMFHKAASTAVQWTCGHPYRFFFAPRRTLIGAVMTGMGRLDEEHWDI